MQQGQQPDQEDAKTALEQYGIDLTESRAPASSTR